jgi:uncharacterized protein YukE
MKILNKIKWFIIWVLLNKKERDLFIANLCHQNDALEQYANCLGETFQEFHEEILKMNENIKIYRKLIKKYGKRHSN